MNCETEIMEGYGKLMEEHDAKCAKRIAKRLAVAKRILTAEMYQALEDELAETDGAYDAYFTRKKSGIAQDAISCDVEFEIFVDQEEAYEDCYHGTVYFPINKTHWLAFDYDC